VSAPAEPTFAWEPITPRGVAAFARAKLSRLLLVQLIVALLAAAAAAWLLDEGCFPVIGDAIQKLPATGEIRSGKLDWPGNSPQRLAEGRILAFDVDLDHSGQINSTADVQIEFGAESVRVFSLLGYVEFFYPPNRVAPFNRPQLEPLWGAWAAEILFFAFAATVLILLLVWWLLATVCFLPVWLLAFYANRDLRLPACWKLTGAALLPGALLMAAGLLLYGAGLLGLVALGFLFAAHFVVGWIYLFVSQFFLPRTSEARPKRNPFHAKLKVRSPRK
jgi:hypothetical protein